MSGCAHMNPQDVCASCAQTKLAALREENARLREDALPDVVPEDVDQLRRERDEARAEVKRLEGLILRWYEGEGNPNVWLAFSKEACRIRAQREEGKP